MKRIFPFLLVFSLVCRVSAQVERPVFTDREIYIGLRSEYAPQIVDEVGGVNTKAFLSLFSEVIQANELEKIEAPFFAAKNTDLQWVLRLSVLDAERVDSYTESFSKHMAARYAERVPVFYLSYTPNDLGSNSYNNQWHLYKIGAKAAWDYSKGNKLVKVAVVDDAVLINHPDLEHQIWVNPGEIPNNGIDDDNNGYIDDVNGYDVGGKDNDPMPNNNNFTHGTHCAGLVGASTNNNLGVASIGFNISIVPVKCTATGQTNTQSIPYGYEGITYAVAAGAKVISCSWSSTFGGTTGNQVINYALNNGALVVAAQGNDNMDALHYPANYSGVISVAATDLNDNKASYSNYNDAVVISAPGNYMLSTVTNNNYASFSGTSMATPLVAGLLGLMKSHMVGISSTSLKTCLINSADNIDANNTSYTGKLGAGRINAEISMKCVDDIKSNLPPDIIFTLENNVYCPNSYVKFSAISQKGAIDSFYWEFPGGVPSYSNDPEPEVYYSGNGSRSYYLHAFNSNGSDKDSVVNGVSFSDQGKAVALFSGFETGLAGSVWNVMNDNDSFGWEDYLLISGTDSNHVARVHAYGSSQNKIKSTLTSAKLNLSDYGNQVLSFEFAYARKSSNAKDSLYIDISVDGGSSFENIFESGLSSDLNVSGNSSAEFVPTSMGQWCKQQGLCVEVDMKKYNRAPDVRIRIRHIGMNNANDFYLDNVRMEGNCAIYNTNKATAATSTPQADSCGSANISFKDESANFPTSFHWYFPGGTPSESYDPNQNVQYNQVGNFDVIYVVGNAFGKDSAVWSNYVHIHELPTISVNSTDTVICKGNSVVLSADGGNTYNWSPLVSISSTVGKSITASPSMSLTYTVLGTDTYGCSNSADIYIDVLPAPSAPTIYMSDTMLFVPVQKDVSYQWFLNGKLIPDATSSSFVPTESGTYDIELTNTVSLCSSKNRTSYNFTVASVNGIVPVEYHLYPNPAKEYINLKQNRNIGSVKIYSIEGKVMLSGKGITANAIVLSTAGLADGIYILEWEADGVPIQEKIVIRH